MIFENSIRVLARHLGLTKILGVFRRPIKKYVINVNNTYFDKHCLFVYITVPFQTKVISDAHQAHWQAIEIARLIGNYGYNVDVVDYTSAEIQLDKTYDMVIGLIPRGIDLYSNHMNPGCIRIAYLTSMNLDITFGNEKKRLAELKKRRGIVLQPRHFGGSIQKDIENFTAAWYIGNEFNFHSYDCFAMPPSYQIINNGYKFDWYNPGLERDSKSFLFFGSLGQVHKGLDLLLELFAEELTDYKLYVCGGYEAEKDFCREYRKELFHTKNIFPQGFVDIKSKKFRSIIEKCAYTILPSCAEGCPGSVLTTMSAGLIPIVSKECGLDDALITLPDCKKDTIKNYIEEYGNKDAEWICEHSRQAVELINRQYSKEHFSASIKRALEGTLKTSE